MFISQAQATAVYERLQFNKSFQASGGVVHTGR